MNILEALNDEHLFAPHFTGESWSAWKGFLAALFALSAPDGTTEAYGACTGRAKPPGAPFTEAALIVGRRGGKSRILALVAVYLAVFRDYVPHLARWRACDDCGARGEPPAGPEHFSVHIGHFESRSAVRADGRGRKHRGDHARE